MFKAHFRLANTSENFCSVSLLSSPPLFSPSICFPKALTPVSPFTYAALRALLRKPRSRLRPVREADRTLASPLQSLSNSSQPCAHVEMRESAGLLRTPCSPVCMKISGEQLGLYGNLGGRM